MSGEVGIKLNETTPVGQVLKAHYDKETKSWSLIVRGGEGDEGLLPVIDLAHMEIHEGNHYCYVSAQDVGGSTTISFVIVVPDTPYVPNLEFFVSGELEYGLDIYEGASPQADGTAVTSPAIVNRNRNMPDVNGMKIYSGPTLGTGSKGTLIQRFHAGSGRLQGGDTRGDNELVLRRNTKYWIDLINATANNNWISWIADWYEREMP